MAQADQAPATSGPTTTIAGVVRSFRTYRDDYGDKRTASLISLPAESGARGLYEVFSPEPLGAVGASVSVVCRVTGKPHGYNVTDPDSGEQRKVQTARHFLAAV